MIGRIDGRRKFSCTSAIQFSDRAGNPGRGDLPFPFLAFGQLGSGAATVATVNAALGRPLKIR